ncbi:FkbM family methyltransferase [Salmonella enterica]|nr:FkbM family methyltransferase [Salmonella enterica]
MAEIKHINLTLNGKERAFFYRDIHSDRSVIQQNLINREYATGMFMRDADIRAHYRSILEAGMTPVIVDCGANIGTSVLHFLGEYSEAHVVAVEPAGDNFALLSRNTAGLNVTLINKGVSSCTGVMALVDTGEPFAYRLTDRQTDRHRIPVIAMCDILSAFEPASLFILKVDIEGGEKAIFSGDVSWADLFFVCLVELHDWLYPGEGTSGPFLRWCGTVDRDFLYRGENIFSVSNRRKR